MTRSASPGTGHGEPVSPGDRAPILERRLGAERLVAYAGATWDWHRLHYDAGYIAQRGLPGPLVDGQMFGALLAEQAIDWFGPRARITRMSFRFAAMVFAGETVRVEGTVESLRSDGDGQVVTLRQSILRPDGSAAVAGATTEVKVPG